MHQMYMRHSRLAARAVVCSDDFEENTNHETDFHARKAEEHRAKAAAARKGGLIFGPNEEKAKAHEAMAVRHDEKEHSSEYHAAEVEHHRKAAEKARKGGEYGMLGKVFIDPQWRAAETANAETEARRHEASATHHEGKAREYQRDQAGKFA